MDRGTPRELVRNFVQEPANYRSLESKIRLCRGGPPPKSSYFDKREKASACCSYEIAPALKQSNRSYGDMPTEADVNVCTTRALAGMIDPVVEQSATFLVPVA